MTSAGGKVDPQETLAQLDEAQAEDKIPDVTMYVYSNSNGGSAGYVEGTVTEKGKQDPDYTYALLIREDGTAKATVNVAEQKLDIILSINRNGGILEFTDGEHYLAAALTVEMYPATSCVIDLYLMEKSRPMMSLTVNAAAGGELTLDLSAEGRKVLNLMEIMKDPDGEAVQGLKTNMTSQLIQLMGIKEVADAIAVLGTLSR